jgi:hypothetical protein
MQERIILQHYQQLLDILPGLIESIRYELTDEKIWTGVIELHKNAIISRLDTFYDALYYINLIKKELGFIFRITLANRNFTHSGSFIAAREIALKELEITEMHIKNIQPLVRKNHALIQQAQGFLIPTNFLFRNFTYLKQL